MSKCDFSGFSTRELLGHADVSYEEAARIIGAAVAKPDLRYQQLPNDQMKGIFMQMGMSENMADT